MEARPNNPNIAPFMQSKHETYGRLVWYGVYGLSNPEVVYGVYGLSNPDAIVAYFRN